MVDEATSDEIRTQQFDVVRKGYDRTQVDTFLAKVATQFDALESIVKEISNRDVSLGIDDDEAMALEMAAIGDEINSILEAARSAAEGMRTRATTHAESATSEAETQAYTAREGAWVEGSAMLEAASDDAQTMVTEAETDVLRIRAEAEREAIRYTTDAKRMSEEAVGAAENEAEGILATARAESERLMRTANQSAELAQERARALEDRRAELLVDLETTRSSIGELETEFEAKRQVFDEPEPVVATEYGDRSHHETDTGSVRIVSASKVVPLRPVDADSFVAEVAELHRARPVEESPQLTVDSSRLEELDSEQLPVDGSQPEESPQLTVGSSQSEEMDSEQVTVDGSQPEEMDSEQLTVDSSQSEGSVGASPFQGGLATSPSEESGGSQQSQLPVDSSQSEDSIGSLFAQLREGATPEKPVEATPVSDTESGQRRADSTSVAENGERETGNAPDTDNASLIPVQNAALRSIKRQLVDLQNDALEHLRVDTAWVPEEAFTDCFSETFGELASSIADSDDDGGAAEVFATDLYDAVSNAVVTTREAGSGDRAIAAATSKVFRTWRSDEAERRVVAVATELSERT